MKTFITFIYLISCTLYLFAQPSYYTQTKTFTENDYIYQCDVRESGMVTLYKKGDKCIYTPQIIRSTGEHFIMYDDTPDIIETVNNDFIYTCKSIINKAFSSTEKQRVKGSKFVLSMYINPDTGKIDEVAFEFFSIGSYATIPISVYRNIELGIKQKLSFKPTTEGKKLNYILYWIDVSPE